MGFESITDRETLTVNGVPVDAVALARARQQLAHEGSLLPSPAWDALSEHDQRMAVLSAAIWLRTLGTIVADAQPRTVTIRPGTATCCEPENENQPGPGRTAKWGVWSKPVCAGDSPIAADRDVVAYAGEQSARMNCTQPGEYVVHRCSPAEPWRQVVYYRVALADPGDAGHEALVRDLAAAVDTQDGLRRIIGSEGGE